MLLTSLKYICNYVQYAINFHKTDFSSAETHVKNITFLTIAGGLLCVYGIMFIINYLYILMDF